MTWIAAIYQTIEDFFTGLVQFLADAWKWIVIWFDQLDGIFNKLWVFITDAWYWVVNKFLSMVGTSLEYAANYLPDFGLAELDTTVNVSSRILESINWLVPFNTLVNCIGIMIASVVSWATVGILFRWLKITV